MIWMKIFVIMDHHKSYNEENEKITDTMTLNSTSNVVVEQLCPSFSQLQENDVESIRKYNVSVIFEYMFNRNTLLIFIQSINVIDIRRTYFTTVKTLTEKERKKL